MLIDRYFLHFTVLLFDIVNNLIVVDGYIRHYSLVFYSVWVHLLLILVEFNSID